jgi:hypothetical protein
VLTNFGLECAAGASPVLLENLWLYSERVLSWNAGTIIRKCRFGGDRSFIDFDDDYMVQFGDGGTLVDCFLYGGPPHSLTAAVEIGGGRVEVINNVFNPYTSDGLTVYDGPLGLESVSIRDNTFVGGSAMVMFYDPADIQFVNNIIDGGLLRCWAGPGPFIARTCFMDEPSPHGCTYADSNIVAWPEFCGPWWSEGWNFNHYYLDASSPCVGAGENGTTIGALDVGCGITGVAWHDSPSLHVHLSIQPNPVRSGATFTFEGIESPALEIYDPNGRLIDLLRPTGQSATWLPGDGARSGVYFARLRGAGGAQVVKFLVVR